jgi:hypothetical protein
MATIMQFVLRACCEVDCERAESVQKAAIVPQAESGSR